MKSARLLLLAATGRFLGRATGFSSSGPHGVVAVVSKHDGPPFLNFISTRTRRLVGRVELTHATDGAEQSVWVPSTGLI